MQSYLWWKGWGWGVLWAVVGNRCIGVYWNYIHKERTMLKFYPLKRCCNWFSNMHFLGPSIGYRIWECANCWYPHETNRNGGKLVTVPEDVCISSTGTSIWRIPQWCMYSCITCIGYILINVHVLYINFFFCSSYFHFTD